MLKIQDSMLKIQDSMLKIQDSLLKIMKKINYNMALFGFHMKGIILWNKLDSQCHSLKTLHKMSD